jgi:hypothetical protein
MLTSNVEAEPHDTLPPPFGFKLRYGVTGGRVSAWGWISIKQLPTPSTSGGKDGARELHGRPGAPRSDFSVLSR